MLVMTVICIRIEIPISYNQTRYSWAAAPILSASCVISVLSLIQPSCLFVSSALCFIIAYLPRRALKYHSRELQTLRSSGTYSFCHARGTFPSQSLKYKEAEWCSPELCYTPYLRSFLRGQSCDGSAILPDSMSMHLHTIDCAFQQFSSNTTTFRLSYRFLLHGSISFLVGRFNITPTSQLETRGYGREIVLSTAFKVLWAKQCHRSGWRGSWSLYYETFTY